MSDYINWSQSQLKGNVKGKIQIFARKIQNNCRRSIHCMYVCMYIRKIM